MVGVSRKAASWKVRRYYFLVLEETTIVFIVAAQVAPMWMVLAW